MRYSRVESQERQTTQNWLKRNPTPPYPASTSGFLVVLSAGVRDKVQTQLPSHLFYGTRPRYLSSQSSDSRTAAGRGNAPCPPS